MSCLDSQFDGTHSLQRIHWWVFPWRNKLIYTLDGFRGVHFQQIVIFGWPISLISIRWPHTVLWKCSVHSHFQEFQLLNLFILTHQFDFPVVPDGRQKRATSVRLGTAPWSRCSWCSPVLKLAHRRLLESHGARDTKGPEPSSVNVYKHAEERIWRRPESKHEDFKRMWLFPWLY